MEEDKLLFFQFELLCLVLGAMSFLAVQRYNNTHKSLFDKLHNTADTTVESFYSSTISALYPSQGCCFHHHTGSANFDDTISLELFPLHDFYNATKSKSVSSCGSTSSVSSGSSSTSTSSSSNIGGVIKKVVIDRGEYVEDLSI